MNGMGIVLNVTTDTALVAEGRPTIESISATIGGDHTDLSELIDWGLRGLKAHDEFWTLDEEGLAFQARLKTIRDSLLDAVHNARKAGN